MDDKSRCSNKPRDDRRRQDLRQNQEACAAPRVLRCAMVSDRAARRCHSQPAMSPSKDSKRSPRERELALESAGSDEDADIEKASRGVPVLVLSSATVPAGALLSPTVSRAPIVASGSESTQLSRSSRELASANERMAGAEWRLGFAPGGGPAGSGVEWRRTAIPLSLRLRIWVRKRFFSSFHPTEQGEERGGLLEEDIEMILGCDRVGRAALPRVQGAGCGACGSGRWVS
ncbi:hypothetical protein B0H10DRAFT_589554 [Mycena sp. CBHHK59/15]|nr:hypothetical protein B0H10DRAFT_589554 [Mycena sp. CBHHK59/15]